MPIVPPPPKVYIPWVREGNARLISQTDTLAAGLPARGTLSANLILNGQAVTTSVQLYGPGDVIGHILWTLDRDQRLARDGRTSFYRRLNQILDAHGFDAFVEEQCAPFYATRGRPSLAHQFTSSDDARAKIEAWRVDYNQHRPHGALGRLTPNEYARRSQEQSTV